MKHIWEGYMWLWKAVGRWHNGGFVRRIALFSLFLARDLVGARRRLLSVLAISLAFLVLLPLNWRADSEPEFTALQLRQDGSLEVDGQLVTTAELGGILDNARGGQILIEVDEDAPAGRVWELQSALVGIGVSQSAFRLQM